MQGKLRSASVALDLARYELTRSGQRVRIERIPMELLILLANSGGRLLTRAEIIDHLWGKNPWLDADRNLNTAIGKIRRALGDDPLKPRYIETAVGKGYRFIATVSTGMDPEGFARNGTAVLVILDSPSPASTDGKPKIPATEIPENPLPADPPAIIPQARRRTVLYGAWAAAGMLLLAVSVYGWKVLDGWGWTFHDRDTSVWIRGDWMVGEYRNCQMTEPDPHRNLPGPPAALPGLFCGEEANGFLEFQAGSAPAPAEHDANRSSAGAQQVSMSASAQNHGFHIMPVRYFGNTGTSDKPLIPWRCRRNNDSLTCKALD